MYSHFLKRNGAPLTDNEKSMIINIHNYLLGDSSTSNDHHKLTLRKHIAEILGVAEGTVGSVVSDWYNRSDDTFTPHKVLRRPKFQPDENVSELLRTKILDANKKAEQLSTVILRQYLLEQGYNFLNGSFFEYYITWVIILARENVETFSMSHQIMLHTVAVIFDFVLLI
ncbi:uncharacterized protein OCT59_015527 [Rhizophagus irregularis]|uniref:uncharacterized protein n=1 Tax=Rhizophagus irregularis TaxID=588596 RepID=UPI000CB69D97|nr:hypothetical protein OCT59_015527 [Rhizophagus irregularis]